VRKAVVCDFGGVLTTPLYESFMHYQEVSGVDFAELVEAMRSVYERTGEHPQFQL
jgi:hypothetical protein